MRFERGFRTAVAIAWLGVATAVFAQPTESDREGRGWLGISIRDPDGEAGPVVTAVDAGGPAFAAGLTPGDIVLRVDGSAVADRAAFVERMQRHAPGERVRLVVRRADGVERAVEIELRARASESERLLERLQGSLPSGGFWAGRPRLGVDVVDVDDDLGRYFAAPRPRCVLVTRVHEDGPAARAGVRAGDLLLAVDGREAHGVEGLQTLIAERTDAATVRIDVWRRDRKLGFDVRLVAAASWLRRPPGRAESVPSGDLEDLRREVRALRREVEDLRRELDLVRRRR